jgi:serine beta-lactamase-like protein LACTB
MKIQFRKLLIIGAIGAGLIPVAIFGLFTYMDATKTPLHPDPSAMPSVIGVAPSADWAAAVADAQRIARAGAATQNLPGLSVAVGIDGRIVWSEGFGWADLEEKIKYSPETRFKIGTASIPLTSAAVGLTLERGQLNLDDRIQKYVPGFPEKQWPVTLRQLMANTAGVRSDGGDEENLQSHCERPVEGIEKFADSDLRAQPGTQFRLSSYGWILIAAAVEAASGEPFDTFMRRNIFEPLGMKDTRPDSQNAALSNRANFYFPKFKADPTYGPQEPMDVDHSCFAGAASFLSTPSDLVRFGMAVNSGKLLQPATVEILHASQRLPSGEETGYGLGWDLENVTVAGQPAGVVGYDGELMGGMVSSLMIFRERGIVIAVISNTAFADTYSLASKLTEPFAAKTSGAK